MRNNQPIERFSGRYYFLSNFYPVKIKLDGRLYRSVEHAYQASKSQDETYRSKIRLCVKPGDAKTLGQKVVIQRKDWDVARLVIMRSLVRQKFTEYLELGKKLVETGDKKLIEGNTWGDNFWGVYHGKGKNHLGKILMEIRDEIQKS